MGKIIDVFHYLEFFTFHFNLGFLISLILVRPGLQKIMIMQSALKKFTLKSSGNVEMSLFESSLM